MRINQYGREITLRDELSDAICENLPRGNIEDEIDSFCSSKEYETLLDEAIGVIVSHVKAGLKDIINLLI